MANKEVSWKLGARSLQQSGIQGWPTKATLCEILCNEFVNYAVFKDTAESTGIRKLSVVTPAYYKSILTILMCVCVYPRHRQKQLRRRQNGDKDFRTRNTPPLPHESKIWVF